MAVDPICYNHVHTRAVTERTSALLKRCWMCLDTVGGELVFSPKKASKIVLARLHSTAVRQAFLQQLENNYN